MKTVTLFIPTMRSPDNSERAGLVFAFKKPYDKARIQKGAEQFLGKSSPVKVVVVNEHTALVLINLDDKYSKPQPADADGPLTPILNEAATGRHAALGGLTIANLPDQLRHG